MVCVCEECGECVDVWYMVCAVWGGVGICMHGLCAMYVLCVVQCLGCVCMLACGVCVTCVVCGGVYLCAFTNLSYSE